MELNGECPWCGGAQASDIGTLVATSLTDRALIDRMAKALTSPRSFTPAEKRALVTEAKRRFNIDT
jgi:hypothetical protein